MVAHWCSLDMTTVALTIRMMEVAIMGRNVVSPVCSVVQKKGVLQITVKCINSALSQKSGVLVYYNE